jgi:ferredoxin-NADP reductase
VRLAVSVRSPDDLLYADELTGPDVTIAYTRQVAPGSERPAGRLSVDDLAPLLLPDATAYVCGSAGFADAASRLLVGLDVPVARIRVERFGPSAPVGS